MEQILVKRANNSEYLLEDKNKGSFISSIIQSTELRSNDVINIELSSREFINFTIGDSFHYLGQKYTLNQIPRYFKNSSNDFQFSITFEGVMFDLRRASYDVNIDTTGSAVYGETLTADLELFAKILIENINRVFPDKWILGELPEATETKTITFSEEENCLAALQMFCDEYDTDFVIKTNNNGVNILNFKQVGNEIPLEFKVGFQKGLYTLTREKVDASDIVTRLKVYGADKNLGTDYRANRLVLKDKNKSNSYIENAQAVAKYGIYESTKIFDDIYPRRKGKVTSINSESVYKFSDSSMDFDLKEKDENGTKYLLNGINAKIHFNTGDLAGYEFEIHDYNHETKEFHIIKFSDENSYEFPSKDNDAFRISVGDEYVILDIQMPQSYIDNAEAELFEKADEYLSDKLEPNIQYLLDVDTLHLQRILNDTVTQFFSIGDFIKVVDEDFDINRYIRIKSIERDLRNPFDYKLTLSDSKVTNFLSGTIPGEINTIKNIIKINNLNNPAKARRNWKDAQEVLNMVFDVEGDYYTEKIKPNSIETTHLQVGAKSMQFNLIDSFFEPNFEGNPNKMRWSTCKLVHFTISDKIVDWQIQGGQKDLEANKPYYLYAKCNKSNNIGIIEITETQYTVDQVGSYYFLVGIINTYSEDVKAREISLMYGFTTVSGRFIKTGRIQSADGNTYFDLDSGEISGKITFTNDSPAYLDFLLQIEKAKQDSIAASNAYTNAQDELNRILAEAYADGVIDDAEQRLIDLTNAKVEAAKMYSDAQDALLKVQIEAYADGVITAEEAERIRQMQEYLAAAKAYADAQAELARIIAAAYADGIVSEEEARAIAEAQAKLEEAKNHAQGLVNNIQIGGRNLLIKSKLIPGYIYPYSGDVIQHSTFMYNPDYITIGDKKNIIFKHHKNNGVTVEKAGFCITFYNKNKAVVSSDLKWELIEGQEIITTIPSEAKYFRYTVTNINFDSKYEFGNKATDWTPAPEDVQSEIDKAKASAEQAIAELINISSDDVLSAIEKQTLIHEWDRIKTEYTTNYSLAQLYGIVTRYYVNAYNDLNYYISPMLVDLNSNSSIIGEVFRQRFKNYYDRNLEILVAINDYLKTSTDNNSNSIGLINQTIDRINKITSFLGTTIDGNVVATGVVLVGDGNEGTGGMSGIRDQGQESIFLYSGQTFNNRYSAPFRVTHGGSVVMTNAYVSGHVTATSGTFSGRIEAQTGYIGGLALQDKLLTTTDVNSGIWFTYENDDYKSSIRMGNNIGTGILPNQNYYPFLMIQNQAKKVVSPWESYKAGIHLDMKSFNDNILSYPAIEVKNGHYQGLAFNVESYSSKSTISRDTDLCYASIASGMPSEVYLPDNPRQGKTLTIINPDPNIGSITVRSRNHSIASKWLHQDKSLSFNATMMLVFMGTSWITIVRT